MVRGAGGWFDRCVYWVCVLGVWFGCGWGIVGVAVMLCRRASLVWVCGSHVVGVCSGGGRGVVTSSEYGRTDCVGLLRATRMALQPTRKAKLPSTRPATKRSGHCCLSQISPARLCKHLFSVIITGTGLCAVAQRRAGGGGAGGAGRRARLVGGRGLGRLGAREVRERGKREGTVECRPFKELWRSRC